MGNPYYVRNGLLSSWHKPITPNYDNPSEGDQIHVCYAESWHPYVLGALSGLLQRGLWRTDAENEIDLACQAAQRLQTRFTQAVPGCPDETDGCIGLEQQLYYNFRLSPAGWERWPTLELDQVGVWVAGEGWCAEVDYDSNAGMYVKLVSIRLPDLSLACVDKLILVYSTECDFAPGGGDYRHWGMSVLTSSTRTLLKMEGINAVTTYSNQTSCYRWGMQTARGLWSGIYGYCGADPTGAGLDICSFKVHEAYIFYHAD